MTHSAEHHLDEPERQGYADGSLAAEQRDWVMAHLTTCAHCAADVDRLRMLIWRARNAAPRADVVDGPTGDAVDDAWPSIRTRIERSKVVALSPTPTAPTAPTSVIERPRSRWPVWISAAVAAALVGALALPRLQHRVNHDESLSPATDSLHNPNLSPVADSSRADEQEANMLLNELELRRAMLGPQEAAAVDHDLRTIDQAIAELKTALTNDPNNPALRRLLASSLRQKVDLLKRATHAS